MIQPFFGVGVNKSTNERQVILKIKSWISERISTLQNYDVERFQFIVNEMQCNEPGCVPIETLIAIVDISYTGSESGPGKWIGKVLKPIMDVQINDIQELDIPENWLDWNQGDSIQIFQISSQMKSVIEKTTSKASLSIISMELTKLLENVQTKIAESNKKITIYNEPQITRVKMVPKPERVDAFQSTITEQSTAMETETTSTPIRMEVKNQVISSPILSYSSETSTSQLSNNKKRSVEVPKFTSSVLNMTNPGGLQPTARHNKEVRQRGCPCCDPDNIENLIDKMIFLEHAPN